MDIQLLGEEGASLLLAHKEQLDLTLDIDSSQQLQRTRQQKAESPTLQSPFEHDLNELRLRGPQRVAADIIRRARLSVSTNPVFQTRPVSQQEVKLLSSPFARRLYFEPEEIASQVQRMQASMFEGESVASSSTGGGRGRKKKTGLSSTKRGKKTASPSPASPQQAKRGVGTGNRSASCTPSPSHVESRLLQPMQQLGSPLSVQEQQS